MKKTVMASFFVHPLRGFSSFSCIISNTEERHLLLPSTYVQQTFEKLPSKVVVVTPDEKGRDIQVKELDGLPYLSDGWSDVIANYGLKEQEMVLFTYSSGSPLYLSFFDVKRTMKPATDLWGKGSEQLPHENDRLVGQLKTSTAASVWHKAASPNSPDVFMRTEPIHRRSVNSKPRKGWCSSSRAEQIAPRLLNFGEAVPPNAKLDMRYSRLPFPWKKKTTEHISLIPEGTKINTANGIQSESKSSNQVDGAKLLSYNAQSDEDIALDRSKKGRYGSAGFEDGRSNVSPVVDEVKYDAAPVGANTIFPVGIALPVYDLPRSNCWITVPKDDGYDFEHLSISPWFALENLTAGDNIMMLTLDGHDTWEVVCEVDFDCATMTTGWKKFAMDNEISPGQSFVLSQIGSIPNGWILSRIKLS